MSGLSESEIDRLKEIHPKKKILRYVFLSIGLFIVILGFTFLIIGYDFKITLNGMNLSLFISIFIMLFGGIIASKYFIAPYSLRENSIVIKRMRDLREPIDSYLKFFSISFSRLIASLLLIISGIISLFVFGTDVGHEVKYGSAISLGGPSWFYVTGLPMLGIGLGLLLYFCLSLFRGIFSKSTNFFFFYELRPGFPWLTEIPKKEIEAIRFQNNHLGPKLTWIILLIPFIVQQLMTSIPLFFVKRAAPSFVLSWTFLIISILEIVALMILVYFPQNYFEIATNDRLYEMWFSPIRFRNQGLFKEEFSNFLECNPEERINSLNPAYDLPLKISKYHIKFFRLTFGIFLVISAVLMLTQMILFGPLVWWLLLMYGFILITKGISFDFNKRDGNSVEISQNSNIFKFKRLSRFKFHFIEARDIKSLTIKKWFRKIDFFDVFGISGIIIFLTLQQIQGWVIADTIGLIYDNIVSTIYMIIILIFIFVYICFPVDVIEFRTPSITYQIDTTLRNDQKRTFSWFLSNFKKTMKIAYKSDLKKTFWIRLSFIGSFIIGTLIYMLIYFIFVY